MDKLLVTGQSGFVGQHLAHYLASHKTSDWQLVNLAPYDLLVPESLDAMLTSAPDAVIHLAGQTFVPDSFRDPANTLQVNLIGTLNLLQALKRYNFSGTFLYVSSGDVYGQVPEDQLPIREIQPVQPRNPYAVSKISAEALCRQWQISEPDWRIIIARPFNHAGPGQSTQFVLPDMARHIALARRAQKTAVLQTGDVDVTRDFLDVRDVIHAYFCLLQSGHAGVTYNVYSGKERHIGDLIRHMANLAGVDLELRQDPDRLRKADQRRAVGNADQLFQHTGWQPQIAFEQTLQDILTDWDKRDA